MLAMNNRMKKICFWKIVLVIAFTLPAFSDQNESIAGDAQSANLSEAPITGSPTGAVNSDKIKEKSNMRIRLTAGDTVLTATMLDNETSRDFISLLPLTLTLKDYAGTEKISDLPKRLSKQGAPSGSDPSVGDITYYSPWGNLAIFYKDFGYSSGLIILGNIESGIEKLASMDDEFTITIELMD